MNVLNYYQNSLIYGNIGQRLSFEFKLADYYCSHEEHIVCENQDEFIYSPLLAMAYDGKTFIASANEAGIVDLSDIYSLQSKARWEFHRNAIFDIKWRPNKPGQLLTASGDLSIGLVDIESPGKKIALIEKSHTCSVRSMDFYDTNVFASGGRDGHIKVWDLRDFSKPVVDIPFAHVVDAKLPRRRNKRYKSCPTNVVTSVLFGSHHLYSGGASDGLLKMWDIRKKQTSKGQIQPFKQIPYGGANNFSDKQGYTCLALSKGNLYASCSDNIIYCYSPQQDKIVCRYKGARINNYTRIAILQDEFLISGSMDKCACIWKIGCQNQEPDQMILPTYVLPETAEVASVEAVSKTGFLFTGTDLGRLRRWTFEPAPRDENGRIISFDEVSPFKVDKQDSMIENDVENIPTITLSQDSNPTAHDTTPRPSVHRKKKRNSPRTISPKNKKAKTKQQSSEPLTPITNYYQKVPKKDSPDCQV